MVAGSVKLGVSSVVLTATLVGSLTGGFMLVQDQVPWLTIRNPAPVVESETSRVRGAALVESADPVLAAGVVTGVMGTDPDLVSGPGWAEVGRESGVPALTFGFGCEADAAVPVLAQTRSWVYSPTAQPPGTTDPGTTAPEAGTGVGAVPVREVTVTAFAYPAGAGALVVDDAQVTALGCPDATVTGSPLLGVNAVSVSTVETSVAIWRRGDVVMMGSVTDRGRAGDLSAAAGVFDTFDKALDRALDGVCVNETAGVDEALRSPYVSGEEFVGKATSEVVRRGPLGVPASVGAVPAPDTVEVDVPAPALDVTILGTLPVAPVPAITKGPAVLPEPVAVPTYPSAPIRPARKTRVPHRLPDQVGPGCGWAFTAQTAPRFDQADADRDFAAAVATAQDDLVDAWAAWLSAKNAYFVAYATYTDDVSTYAAYVAEVTKTLAAWDVVETARAEYAAALAAYEAQVSARAAFRDARVLARLDYRAAQDACRNRPDDTAPAPVDPTGPPATDPTTGPSTGPTPVPGTDPTATPTSTNPTATPSEPVLVCPPLRPEVLSQDPPVVGPSPTPAPAAQLPPSVVVASQAP